MILSHIMKHIHGTGQLITVTALLGVIIITVIGEASVTFLMIGGLFREEYIKRGLETKNLFPVHWKTVSLLWNLWFPGHWQVFT